MLDPSDRGSPARPLRRRRWPQLATVAGALLLTLALTACAGGKQPDGVASLSGSAKPTATTTAGGSGDPRQAALQFARCMREHGIDMPDPKFNGNGGISITVHAGGRGPKPDDPKFKAAEQACQRFMPKGGQTRRPNPQQLQRALQFARCMRQHGIDVPDPGADGGIQIRGSGPDDPRFKAAQQACQQYAPDGGKGQTVTGGGSSSANGDDR
ncbi:MAG TPA: hypothetical protein VGC06_18975 [Actinomycetes bacterium]